MLKHNKLDDYGVDLVFKRKDCRAGAQESYEFVTRGGRITSCSMAPSAASRGPRGCSKKLKLSDEPKKCHSIGVPQEGLGSFDVVQVDADESEVYISN